MCVEAKEALDHLFLGRVQRRVAAHHLGVLDTRVDEPHHGPHRDFALGPERKPGAQDQRVERLAVEAGYRDDASVIEGTRNRRDEFDLPIETALEEASSRDLDLDEDTSGKDSDTYIAHAFRDRDHTWDIPRAAMRGKGAMLLPHYP